MNGTAPLTTRKTPRLTPEERSAVAAERWAKRHAKQEKLTGIKYVPPDPAKGYKPRSTIKSPALQVKVLLLKDLGTPEAKIGRDLNLDPRTVKSIIDMHQVDRQLEANQRVSVGLVPKAIQVAHERLAKGSENMAIKVLENTIWPLQGKTARQADTGLTVAIQNLMGGVTVVAPVANPPKPLEVEALNELPNKVEPERIG